ncbi:hypothetical protein Q5752_004151 [Cryptotrichosporon argae]
MAAPLKHLKVNATGRHTATVIFLHGLGDSGHGWLPVAKMLYPSLPHVKWVLPHAPAIPITVNNGYRMPGWFDIASFEALTAPSAAQAAELLATVDAVDALVQAEVDAGVPEHRIVLGGFSQGGAVSILSALVKKRRYAGVVALSTWVPMSEKVHEHLVDTAKDTPVFWGHGKDDDVVQYQYGVRSIEFLKKLGFPAVPAGEAFRRPGLRFESYDALAHSSSPRELEDLRAWLVEALK